ncbi:MAG: hypothetical protein WCB85_12045 [Candidatus Dormiibacterota bacterium]
MSNRLTRVPTGAPPSPPAWGSPAVQMADLFMRAMLSRPATGSLRNTWVTPASMVLSLVSGLGATALLIVCAAAFVHGGGWGWFAGILLCGGFAAGALSVGEVGLTQRRRT